MSASAPIIPSGDLDPALFVGKPFAIVNEKTFDLLAIADDDDLYVAPQWTFGRPRAITTGEHGSRIHYPLRVYNSSYSSGYKEGKEDYGTVRIYKSTKKLGVNTEGTGKLPRLGYTIKFYGINANGHDEFEPKGTGRWGLLPLDLEDERKRTEWEEFLAKNPSTTHVEKKHNPFAQFFITMGKKVAGIFSKFKKIIRHATSALGKLAEWANKIVKDILEWVQEGHVIPGGLLGDNISVWNVTKALSGMIWHLWRHHGINSVLHILKPIPANMTLGSTTQLEWTKCKVYNNATVKNWGDNISSPAQYVFVPKTVLELQQIINNARENNKSLRATGYTHSWAPVYLDQDQYSIAFIEPEKTYPETLRNNVHRGAIDKHDELHFIDDKFTELVDPSDGQTYGLLRCGAGARNLDFLHLCHEKKFQYTIPFNVIMTEITFGGSTSMICHGAGITSTTLSDLVYEIELVDYNGNIRKYSRANEADKSIMESAAGCFGLFGVITHLTLKLPKMSIAQYSPYSIQLHQAIPTPDGMSTQFPEGSLIPSASRSDEKHRQVALDRLKTDMTKYYAEWFWFPFQKGVWVNCWDNNTTLPLDDYYDHRIVDRPDRYYGILTSTGRQFDEALDHSCNLCSRCMGQFASSMMPTNHQTFDTIGRKAAKEQQTNDVLLIEAVHFRRGIHAMPVRDMEAEIRIPDPVDGDDSKAVSMLQELWWAAIQLAGEYSEKNLGAPLTMALEMRLTGTATATLAAQYGNNRTASIEVLSMHDVDHDAWNSYCIALWKRWEIISEANNGTKTAIKPHWAKEWTMLLGDQGANLDLHALYGEQMNIFMGHLEQHANAGKPAQTSQDYLTKFGNSFLRNLFGSVTPSPPALQNAPVEEAQVQVIVDDNQ